jgi:hypothetical protein
MPKVFLHIRAAKDAQWVNSSREFLRLPVVGEHLATETDSPWYRVDLVVHCPFEADYAAEVYATQVDHREVMRSIR